LRTGAAGVHEGRKGLGILGLFSLLGLLMAGMGFAQVTTATLYGTVVDPSGANIPKAAVTLLHQQTGATLSKVSGAGGDFQFDFLRVGTYTLRIEAQGFKRFQSVGMELGAGQTIRQNYPLQVGDVSETVQVQDTVSQVNTVSAEQLQEFNSKTVTDLPLARRNFSNILRVGAGVTAPATGGGVRLNGMGRNGTGYSVDGTEASANAEGSNPQSFSGVGYVDILSTEAIDEVNVVKGILPAEYGYALGGQVNVITRSGTNQFHGSLFENFQNIDLNARDPFLAVKAPYTYNQFGASAGGAIKKNRIFFFGVYEGYRENAQTRVFGNVPTPSIRSMILQAQPIYADALAPVPLPNQPFAENATSAVYSATGAAVRRDNHADVKADFRLKDNSNLSLTYSRGRPYQLVPAIYVNGQQTKNITTERGTASYVMGGASWTSESRYGYTMNDALNVYPGFGPQLDAAHPSEQFFFGRRLGQIRTNLGWNTIPNNSVMIIRGPTWDLGEKFSEHVGRHSLKFGGLYTIHCCQRDNPNDVSWTYSSLADLLTNTPSAVTPNFGQGAYTAKMWEMGAFAQDDWQVTPRLTLNLGLRYDWFNHMTAKQNNNSGAFLTNPTLLNTNFDVGPLRPADDAYDSNRVNFGPRFGFAYDIGGKGKTVIRGGTGLSYSPQVSGNIWNFVGSKNLPVAVTFSKQDALTYGLQYPLYNDDLRVVASQLAATKGITYVYGVIDPHLPSPYTHNYNLGFQHALTSTLMVESSVVGLRGTHFPIFRGINEPTRATGIRPNPSLSATYYLDGSATSRYISWQTSLRKQYSRNIAGSVHYTWGKTLATNGGDTGTWYQGDNALKVQNFFNLAAERGPAAGDITHNLSSEWTYDTPSLSGANRIVRQIFGRWLLGGIFTAHTGEPLSITETSSLQVARPDYIGGNAVADNYGQTLQYLNKSAFALVPVIAASGATSRPGNLGWGEVRGPGMWNVDVSLGKNIKLKERVQLLIRSDMLDAFNHLNPTSIATSINAGNFGQIQDTLGSRVIQLNARLSW
jgi:hypothetical protein